MVPPHHRILPREIGTVNPRYNDSQYNDFRIITMRYAGTVDFMCRITINPVYRYRKDLASNLAGIVVKPIISSFWGVNLGADAPELSTWQTKLRQAGLLSLIIIVIARVYC